MSDKAPLSEKNQQKLERKKQALKDNLKKRKALVKGLANSEQKQMLVRQRGLKSKSAE